MAAYVIANLQVRNTARRTDYGERTLDLIHKHGGKVLAPFGSRVEVLEPSDKHPRGSPTAIVLLEFPTAQAAEAWYQDPEYQPLIALRKQGADGDLYLVEATASPPVDRGQG